MNNRERCDHCQKWIADGHHVFTLENIVSEGVDFNWCICAKCLVGRAEDASYWDNWVKRRGTPPRLTPDDFRLLSKSQHRCIAYYAVGGAEFRPVTWSQRTLDSLVRRGMLKRCDRKMGGGLTIHDYEMPIAAHIAWCEWCDEPLEE